MLSPAAPRQVAARLGVELVGVNLPGHYFLTPADPALEFLIDPFEGERPALPSLHHHCADSLAPPPPLPAIPPAAAAAAWPHQRRTKP